MFFLLKRIRAIPSHKHVNKHTCTWSSLQASLLFVKSNKRKMEAASSQTECPVFKRLQCHIGERILTWLTKFFHHSALDFTFNKKRLANGYCFVSQLNDPFLTPVKWLSNVKSLVLHLLSVPHWGGHIINIFFHQFIARALHVWTINRWEKTRSVVYSTDRKDGEKS